MITDLEMPDLDGLALTEAITVLSPRPAVVWMTAYNGCTNSAEMARLRVHACLDKPIEIGEIRRIVSEALWGDAV